MGADVANRYINAAGELVTVNDGEEAARYGLISVAELSQLKATSQRPDGYSVCCVAGRAKGAALCAALKGGLFNVVIADAAAAQRALEVLENERPRL